MSWRRLGLSLLAAMLLAADAAAGYLYGSAGSWSVAVHLPGDVTMPVRVTPLLRLGTSVPGRRLLDKTTWHTRTGVVRFLERDEALLMTCEKCRLHVPRFSASSLEIPVMYLRLQRDGDVLSGWISDTDVIPQRRITFDGRLSRDALALHWELERNPLSNLLRIISAAVPEAQHADVRGLLSAHGTLELPGGRWSAVPQLEGFEVYGLGTEQLRYGSFKYVCHDENGMPVMRITGDSMPGWMPLQRMARALPRAVLAAEDARFFGHAGYDLDELAPLLANAERKGRRGASTLTQQLAKNFFTGAEATGARKLRELLYAVEMERTLGKARILSLYLNTVDWGPGLCGIADASAAYFGRTPEKLALVEAAWLAGILRNPHRAYQVEFIGRNLDRSRLEWVMGRLPRLVRKRSPGTLQFAQPAASTTRGH